MNKASLLAGVVSVLAGRPSFAQGTFAFSNATLPGKPRILGCDGLGIAGANYLIDVLVKNPLTGEFTNAGLLKVTTQGENPTVPISPLSGFNAGLFAGATVKVPFVAPGAYATIKVIVWDKNTGATYDTAILRGNLTFDIAKLGGSGSPPSLPAAMAGFTSFIAFGLACDPEPSTGALAVLGMGLLLVFRRK